MEIKYFWIKVDKPEGIKFFKTTASSEDAALIKAALFNNCTKDSVRCLEVKKDWFTDCVFKTFS